MIKNKRKYRQYVPSYIQYGFIIGKNNPLLPQCLICLMQQTNASTKPAILSLHLNKCHPSLANKPKEYFEALRESLYSSSSKEEGFLIEHNSAPDSPRHTTLLSYHTDVIPLLRTSSNLKSRKHIKWPILLIQSRFSTASFYPTIPFLLA